MEKNKIVFTMICTTYTVTKYGLILRNNWTEENVSVDYQQILFEKYKLPEYAYQKTGSISKIYEGKMELDNVVIHVRVIKNVIPNYE